MLSQWTKFLGISPKEEWRKWFPFQNSRLLNVKVLFSPISAQFQSANDGFSAKGDPPWQVSSIHFISITSNISYNTHTHTHNLLTHLKQPLEWRGPSPDGIYRDIYDGSVWSDLIQEGFLDEKRNIVFFLGADGFCKFRSRATSSCRFLQERKKKENFEDDLPTCLINKRWYLRCSDEPAHGRTSSQEKLGYLVFFSIWKYQRGTADVNTSRRSPKDSRWLLRTRERFVVSQEEKRKK